MANFCLPQFAADKFIESLKDGSIDPKALMDMTSAERRDFFKKIVGEEHAREVNALLESKLILKDQKRGLVSWAKKVAGISEVARTDIIAKIDRMSKALTSADEATFLEDLAAKKLGTDVTFEEAQRIVDGAKAVDEARKAIPDKSPQGSDERLAYGLKYVEFQKYVAELKQKGGETSWKEWITSPGHVFDTVAGTTKSILASMDNSFFGRQGIKMLYTNPDIWGKAFMKSWGDIGKEIIGIDAQTPVKAEIYSRDNALNGKYAAGKYDIGILSEEAYPSTLPEKIPVLGRLYKASESAFTNAALRMRADYTDRIIARAEEFGINTLDKVEAEGLGQLVNSMTGRGHVNLTPGQAKFINSTVFSIKFLKSNFDTLTAHRGGFGIEKGATRDFVRRESAKNLAKMVGVTAAILGTANILFPGSVNFDPRSPSFGKIRIGKNTFDVTGGMGSILTLAARITPSMHNGKWGLWSVDKKGNWMQLNDPKFGRDDGVDVIENFFEGKLSPIAGVGRDLLSGRRYDGKPVTFWNETLGAITPIPVQTFQKLQDQSFATQLGVMIADGLGISVNTDNPTKKK